MAWEESICEKIRGEKSRWTIPLRSNDIMSIVLVYFLPHIPSFTTVLRFPAHSRSTHGPFLSSKMFRGGWRESIKSTARKDEVYPLLGKIEKFHSHVGWMNSSQGEWRESIAWEDALNL
jgi:hypothetical protein